MLLPSDIKVRDLIFLLLLFPLSLLLVPSMEHSLQLSSNYDQLTGLY